MLLLVWVVLVLVGSGAGYFAFIAKRAAPLSSLITFGTMTVASFGAVNLETVAGVYTESTATGETASPVIYTTNEAAAAILCGTIAVVAAIVTMAAVTGQYGDDRDQDPEDTPGGTSLARELSRR